MEVVRASLRIYNGSLIVCIHRQDTVQMSIRTCDFIVLIVIARGGREGENNSDNSECRVRPGTGQLFVVVSRSVGESKTKQNMIPIPMNLLSSGG